MPEHDYKNLTKEELGDLINKVMNKEDDKPVIYTNPMVDKIICEEITKELKHRIKDIDTKLEFKISKHYNYKAINNDDFICTNSNCIRRNKCSHYLSKKGFSKPGVMIDNGNSCKQFNPK